MGSKKEKGKALLANVWLFFLAGFIPKAITFFMVPLYTECLTTEEYGMYWRINHLSKQRNK